MLVMPLLPLLLAGLALDKLCLGMECEWMEVEI